MMSATTSDISGLSGVVGAQPDAFAGPATPSSTTAKAFIARSGWLAGEGRRLDAAAYSSGGLAARDRIIKGAQPWQRLDQVARTFYEGNRSVGAKRYAARGSGALSVVGCTWGSRDGDGVPVRWAAQAAVR